ncbi:hypothetical protein [Brevundimonas sp.]
MYRFLGASIAVAAIMGVSAAAAQDYTLSPNYGDVRLSSGFSPDPHTVSVTAGGSIDAAKLGSPCSGSISNAPDVQVNYSPGSLPLIFRTASDSDTTLIVNAPDGQWYCNDDGFTDLGAEVRFNSPRSGNYDVWIGTFGGGTAAATLYVTELNSSNYGPNSNSAGGTINSGLTATYGEVRLNSGFTPDPHRVNLTAGGSIQASSAAQDCSGMVAAAPDYQITYSAGSLPLVIRTDSSTDTTLLVNGPGGEWYCDDDGAGSLNAQVRLNKPSSGVYDIWVGTFGSSTASATLSITELP